MSIFGEEKTEHLDFLSLDAADQLEEGQLINQLFSIETPEAVESRLMQWIECPVERGVVDTSTRVTFLQIGKNWNVLYVNLENNAPRVSLKWC